MLLDWATYLTCAKLKDSPGPFCGWLWRAPFPSAHEVLEKAGFGEELKLLDKTKGSKGKVAGDSSKVNGVANGKKNG